MISARDERLTEDDDMKKTTKPKKSKPATARRGPRTVEQAWREDLRASNGPVATAPATPTLLAPAHALAAPVATTTEPTSAPLAKPRPLARMHRRLATPAQRRGSDLVRYLRIHAKKPFGRRGEEAIRRLAVETAHMANLELNARETN